MVEQTVSVRQSEPFAPGGLLASTDTCTGHKISCCWMHLVSSPQQDDQAYGKVWRARKEPFLRRQQPAHLEGLEVGQQVLSRELALAHAQVHVAALVGPVLHLTTLELTHCLQAQWLTGFNWQDEIDHRGQPAQGFSHAYICCTHSLVSYNVDKDDELVIPAPCDIPQRQAAEGMP